MRNKANVAADSTPVLIRFGVRLAILIVFAAVGCEPMFGPVLTHWDEAAGLVVLSKLAALIA
jgi:hypothetical protein